MRGLHRQHSQREQKPPVTGLVDAQKVFQQLSARRFSVSHVDDRSMAADERVALWRQFLVQVELEVSIIHLQCSHLITDDLLDFFIHLGYLHDTRVTIWLQLNFCQLFDQSIRIYQFLSSD